MMEAKSCVQNLNLIVKDGGECGKYPIINSFEFDINHVVGPLLVLRIFSQRLYGLTE